MTPRVPLAPHGTNGLVGDGLPWFVEGPSGTRAYASFGEGALLRWHDGRRAASVDATLRLRDGRVVGALREGSFAWTGERYLVVTSEQVDAFELDVPYDLSDWRNHRVFTTDEQHNALRAVRTVLPPNACDVRVTSLGTGALLTWFRRNGDNCRIPGEAWALAFNHRGEPIAPARPLTFAGETVRVRALTARWDFGRAVLTGRGDRTVTWILDTVGSVVATQDTNDVVCPRTGCARVRLEAERSEVDGTFGGGVSVRFEPFGNDRMALHRSFLIRLQKGTLRGLAVSSDLVLLLHSPQGGGCDLSIVDLEQRLVVAEHHEASTRACEERHVHALPRGFVLAGYELPQGPFTVSFDCTRPPR